MCIQISDLRLIFRNEQIFTQEDVVNLHSVGGVPNTRDDGRWIRIGPFKYTSVCHCVTQFFFFIVSLRPNLCRALTTQKLQKTCTLTGEKRDFASAQCAFECKNISYWSQAKDDRLSSAQTLPRSSTDSTVTICNYCVSLEECSR